MTLASNFQAQIVLQKQISALETELKELQLAEKTLWQAQVWGKMTWGDYLQTVGL